MHPELVARFFGEAQWSRLEAVADILSREAFISFGSGEAARLLPEADILFAAWGAPALEPEILSRARNLRLVAYAAASIRPIATPAFWDSGIPITSAVAAMAIPVAEFTYAAIILTGKDVFRLRDLHRAERGRRGVGVRMDRDTAHLGNFRRRVGIVGASRIGRLVIEMLVTSGFPVGVYDPFVSADEIVAMGAEPFDLKDLLSWSDTVSLHAPILPETRHMIGQAELALMRDGAILINTARGWLVDHAALASEVQSGRLSTWIDTPEPDPLPPQSPFYDLAGAILTPHIAGAMGNELHRLCEAAIAEVERLAEGRPPLHQVLERALDRIA